MATDADGVTTTDSPAATPERPIENLKAEFGRKMGSLEHKFDQVLNYIAQKETVGAPVPEAPKGTRQAMTDDELWDAAKAGDKGAFDLYEERKAARVYQGMRGQENHQNLVDSQLGILNAKYPVLSNPQHPLTQTANTAYAHLTRRGYGATQATYLEAVKTAIADRPDIVAELHTQGARAREGARRVSAGNSGVTGSTVRQDEPSAQEGRVRVTPEMSAIARRMNVKDPQKAIANFLKRQESGESKFGAVAGSLPQGEF